MINIFNKSLPLGHPSVPNELLVARCVVWRREAVLTAGNDQVDELVDGEYCVQAENNVVVERLVRVGVLHVIPCQRSAVERIECATDHRGALRASSLCHVLDVNKSIDL